MFSGMYGSAAELALYLRLYRNFPMSYKFFGNHSFEPYRVRVFLNFLEKTREIFYFLKFQTHCEVWKSIKNEEFISKHDLRVWMESEVCFILKDAVIFLNYFLNKTFGNLLELESNVWIRLDLLQNMRCST